jgi:hypothetical protein
VCRDGQNFVYFHDVLFKMIKKEFGVQDANNGLIKKEEERVAKVIKGKIDKFRKANEKDTVKNPLNTFNPLTSHLYFKISFVYLKTFISKQMLLTA